MSLLTGHLTGQMVVASASQCTGNHACIIVPRCELTGGVLQETTVGVLQELTVGVLEELTVGVVAELTVGVQSELTVGVPVI